jgi:hypothetical protein
MRKRGNSNKAEYILRMSNYDASDEEVISEAQRAMLLQRSSSLIELSRRRRTISGVVTGEAKLRVFFAPARQAREWLAEAKNIYKITFYGRTYRAVAGGAICPLRYTGPELDGRRPRNCRVVDGGPLARRVVWRSRMMTGLRDSDRR